MRETTKCHPNICLFNINIFELEAIKKHIWRKSSVYPILSVPLKDRTSILLYQTALSSLGTTPEGFMSKPHPTGLSPLFAFPQSPTSEGLKLLPFVFSKIYCSLLKIFHRSEAQAIPLSHLSLYLLPCEHIACVSKLSSSLCYSSVFGLWSMLTADIRVKDKP